MLTDTASASAVPRVALLSSARRELLFLSLLLLFTFGKGALWAAMIAPLDAPDEPSHFNYVVQVRQGTRLPVVDLVSPGGLRTPPSTPLNGDLRDYFARYDYKFFRSMPYESAQPPLYYWLSAAWTLPMPVQSGSFSALLLTARLLSVLMATFALFAFWLACRLVAPGSWLPLAAPLALTLHPEFSFTMATVSNDAGAVFFGALLLAVWAYGLHALRQGAMSRREMALVTAFAALLTGAGVLTKFTFVATVPATLLWLFWLVRSRPGKGSVRAALFSWLPWATVFSVLSGLVVLPWVARNMRTYGEPTGARAIFNLIHKIYWDRNGFPGNQLFSQFPPLDFVVRSVRSFWALFGWATVWLDPVAYWVLAAFALVSGAGLVALVLRRKNRLPQAAPGKLLILAGLTFGAAFANYLGYNSLVEFQPHMRYTFVALVPTVLLLVSGLLFTPLGSRARTGLLVSFLAVLALTHIFSLLSLWSHTQYVLSQVK